MMTLNMLQKIKLVTCFLKIYLILLYRIIVSVERIRADSCSIFYGVMAPIAIAVTNMMMVMPKAQGNVFF